MRTIRILAISAVFFCNLFAHTQSRTLVVSGTPTTTVTVTPFTEDQFPSFKKIFEASPAAAKVEPAAVVLGNVADKPIIGVAVRWTLVGIDGKEEVVTSYSHSYLLPHSPPLVGVNEHLLIAPDIFVPETVVKSQGLSGPVPPQNSLAQFEAARQLRFAIDAIIFADGEVVGPNALPMIRRIKDRYVAATLVVKCVREARSQGKDPVAELRNLPTRASAWNRDVSRHVALFAAQLVRTRHFEATLEYFANVPAPPQFFRKDGSQL